MARDWDASTYERLSQPLAQMGKDVLARLELTGDETVLDAGCGTGKVTAALLERLPKGRVIAVDAAPSMVEEARQKLPGSVGVRQPICSPWGSTSRSTRSSRRRRSTGSAITTACSRTCSEP